MIEALVNSILDRRDLTASEKLVLVVISKEQGGRMYCQLSRKEIGAKCGLSEATVKRSVIDLAARHIITCRRKKLAPDLNEKNTYSVMWVNNFNRRRNWLRKEAIREAS